MIDSGPSLEAWGALMARHEGDGLILRATPEGLARIAKGGVYLATPYTRLVTTAHGGFDLAESVLAAEAAALVAQDLARRGVSCFSPIVMAHAMIAAGDKVGRHGIAALDPLDAGFWEQWCRPWLYVASVVAVPDLRGWSESDGVWHEAHAALATLRRVVLLETGSWM